MTRRIALLFLLSIVGCANEHPTVAASREVPIVDGTRELGEEAVVYVAGVIGACTGTLITDRVVLTAKHCVQTRGAAEPAPPSFFTIGVGNTARALMSTHRVREVITTPGAFTGSAITDGTDIALMILRDPITGIPPIPVRRADPGPLTGREVTAIGFGQTPAGESGVKYRTTTAIESMNAGVIFGRMAICQGDSGGPLILEADGTSPREIVGVASFGQTMIGGPSCPAVLDAWNRVDVELDLIDLAVLRSGACVDRGEETCNGLDDDCNGTVDDGCAELGEACETDADCRYAPLPEALREGTPPGVVCADVGGSRRCALPCDPLAPTTSCRTIDVAFTADDVAVDGFFCAQTAGCEGLCVEGAPGEAGPGAACARDADCASLFCVEDAGVCASPCRGGVATCPTTEVCVADAGACGFCADPSARPSGRALGEPCTSTTECASGGCGDTGDGVSVCTAACENDLACGEAMRCVDGFCARGGRAELFGHCTGDDDCTGSTAACVALEGRSFCSTRCSDAGGCTGTCTPVSDSEMRCFPADPLLGAPCTDVCAQGECIEGTCTAVCGGDLSCPLGHDCVREGARTVCRAHVVPGGCSIAGPGAGGGSIAALRAGRTLRPRARRARRARRRASGT